ncbi:unnamed protein product [Paramecium sonneborni]|uniref:Sperm-tail PG-rich repeat protein n=1 Tax=Paramecium sonneborni TaxID=65129 RepID=A0A8S1QUU2_9CILI|nr:unnamed protein product [Paramecium sonneborni]
MLDIQYIDKVLPVAEIVASNQPQVNKLLNEMRLSAYSNRSGITTKINSIPRIRIKTQEQILSNSENLNSYTYYRQNSQRYKQNVGPGSYEIQNPAHLQQNCPSISFTKGQRKQLQKFQNPGPGQYNILYNKQQKTFVFNSRHNSEQQEQFPGPGTYDLNLKSFRSISFGTSRKLSQNDPKFITPGPGTYNINQKVEKKKIDRIERLLKPKLMVRSYYNRKEDKFIQELVKQQLNKKKEESNQRPKSAMQIKQQKRRKNIERIRRKAHEKLNSPGPGSYDIKDFIQVDHIDKKKGKILKQNQEEKSKINDSLGPGSYDIKDFLYYSESIKKSNTNTSFGKSKRFEVEKHSGLGPGSYEIIDYQN